MAECLAHVSLRPEDHELYLAGVRVRVSDAEQIPMATHEYFY